MLLVIILTAQTDLIFYKGNKLKCFCFSKVYSFPVFVEFAIVKNAQCNVMLMYYQYCK